MACPVMGASTLSWAERMEACFPSALAQHCLTQPTHTGHLEHHRLVAAAGGAAPEGRTRPAEEGCQAAGQPSEGHAKHGEGDQEPGVAAVPPPGRKIWPGDGGRDVGLMILSHSTGPGPRISLHTPWSTHQGCVCILYINAGAEPEFWGSMPPLPCPCVDRPALFHSVRCPGPLILRAAWIITVRVALGAKGSGIWGHSRQ